MENNTTSPGYGRVRRKLIRDRTTPNPVENTLKLYVEILTPEQLEEARATIEENPDVITVVDRNDNTNSKQNKVIRQHKPKTKMRQIYENQLD